MITSFKVFEGLNIQPLVDKVVKYGNMEAFQYLKNMKFDLSVNNNIIIEVASSNIYNEIVKDIYHAIEEAAKFGLDIDPIDDNIIFDEKENRYKIIDYL